MERVNEFMRRTRPMVMLFIALWMFFQLFNFSATQYGITLFLGPRAEAMAVVMTLAFVLFDIVGYVAIAYIGKPIDAFGLGVWTLGTLTNAGVVWYALAMAISPLPIWPLPMMTSESFYGLVPFVIALGTWAMRTVIVTFIGYSTKIMEQSWRQPATASTNAQHS